MDSLLGSNADSGAVAVDAGLAARALVLPAGHGRSSAGAVLFTAVLQADLVHIAQYPRQEVH